MSNARHSEQRQLEELVGSADLMPTKTWRTKGAAVLIIEPVKQQQVAPPMMRPAMRCQSQT